MNRRENTMTIRTVGLYLVLAGLSVGFFTAALLVAKHSQDTQVVATGESEQRDDGRYKLAIAPTDPEQVEPVVSEGAASSTTAAASVATTQPATSRQAPLNSPVATTQPAPIATSSPASPVSPAPPQSAPQAVSQQPATVASAPEQQPSVLGKLLDGVLGILALR